MNEENKKIEILTDTINTPDEIRDASAEKRKKSVWIRPGNVEKTVSWTKRELLRQHTRILSGERCGRK